MTAFSAFQLAKRLFGENLLDKEQARQLVLDYTNTVAAHDNRRLMWITERAAEDCAARVGENEQAQMLAEHFGRAEEAAKAEDAVTRLTEDFKLLYGLLTYLRHTSMEASAEGFAEFFRQRGAKPRGKKAPPKQRPGE